MTGYRRELSLDSALAHVEFAKDGVTYRRDYFASFPANVIAVRFGASKTGKQNLVISYAPNPVSEGKMTVNGNNELLWNAQIAQSFLKNKAATLSIQFYDILQKQSNVSRMISATQRTDSWNNAINSYFMVHFIYKLNIFPGGSSKKGDDKTDRPGPPDMRGPGGMPMRPMGGPGGGMGGRF